MSNPPFGIYPNTNLVNLNKLETIIVEQFQELKELIFEKNNQIPHQKIHIIYDENKALYENKNFTIYLESDIYHIISPNYRSISSSKVKDLITHILQDNALKTIQHDNKNIGFADLEVLASRLRIKNFPQLTSSMEGTMNRRVKILTIVHNSLCTSFPIHGSINTNPNSYIYIGEAGKIYEGYPKLQTFTNNDAKNLANLYHISSENLQSSDESETFGTWLNKDSSSHIGPLVTFTLEQTDRDKLNYVKYVGWEKGHNAATNPKTVDDAYQKMNILMDSLGAQIKGHILSKYVGSENLNWNYLFQTNGGNQKIPMHVFMNLTIYYNSAKESPYTSYSISPTGFKSKLFILTDESKFNQFNYINALSINNDKDSIDFNIHLITDESSGTTVPDYKDVISCTINSVKYSPSKYYINNCVKLSTQYVFCWNDTDKTFYIIIF